MIRWLALPPIVVLFYSSLVASITVPMFLIARREFPTTVFNRDAWLLLAALVISSLANNLTYFYALAQTTVSNAVFTHYTAPVFVALLAPLLISERIRKETLVSLTIALLGLGMIVFGAGGLRLGGGHGAGIAAGTASGVAYAFLILVSRMLSRRLMHSRAIIVLLWATALITAPIALTMEYRLDLRAIILLACTGVFHSTIAPLLYFSGLRHVLAQHAAILGYIEPLAAVPLAFLFLSEQPSTWAVLGGIFILLSGYIVIRERQE